MSCLCVLVGAGETGRIGEEKARRLVCVGQCEKCGLHVGLTHNKPLIYTNGTSMFDVFRISI